MFAKKNNSDVTNWKDWLTSAMWEGRSHFLMQRNQSVLQRQSMSANQLLLGSRWRAQFLWINIWAQQLQSVGNTSEFVQTAQIW